MKRRILAVVLAVPVLCGAAALAWPRGGAEYRRFVSKPLRDGTRYTFLYPARFSDKSVAGPDAFLLDDVQSRATLLDHIQRYTHIGRAPVGLAGLLPGEITVQVETTEPKQTKSRLEFKESGRLFLLIEDARSKMYFSALHTNRSGDQSRFDAEGKVFSESFQVLPPGVPVPAA